MSFFQASSVPADLHSPDPAPADPALKRVPSVGPLLPVSGGKQGRMCDLLPYKREHFTSTASRTGCVFEQDPHGVAAEQFRLMQRRLRNLRPSGSSVLITSAVEGEGKSFNARNLAWAFSESGNETLLLDLDLRRPAQWNWSGAPVTRTLAEVIRGTAAPEEALCRLAPTPLFLIGLESPISSPTDLLRSSGLRSLTRWSRERFQWVVIDGPPVMPVADIEEILPDIDLVLLVARERFTPSASLKRATERLGKRLSFLIYNGAEQTETSGYGTH